MVHDIATEDKLDYNFFPVTTGSINFKVKAGNDAHVALTSTPAEGDNMYEIFIGGWGNAKTAIRRSRQKPDKAEAETPDILNGDEHRGFWIRWDSGSIAVGKEGEDAPFVAWEDPEPFGIGYFGICTGWGATGEWIIENAEEISTPDALEYNFRPIPNGSIKLKVRAPHNAHISLTNGPQETEPMYEIIIGGWENTASVIRYNREKPDKVRVDTPGILDDSIEREFDIKWKRGTISLEAGGVHIGEWQDPEPIGISFFGVRTAWGASGQWRISCEHFSESAPKYGSYPGASTGTELTWVDASGGEIPPNAVMGGFDDEYIYVARANHEGALLPGKLVPSHGVCYVPWGGEEHGHEEYQVLCGGEVDWQGTAGTEIPAGAVPGGQSEDGEGLFIGRVSHEGAQCIGKVHPSHGVIYIPYGGLEVSYPEFEVLVSK